MITKFNHNQPLLESITNKIHIIKWNYLQLDTLTYIKNKIKIKWNILRREKLLVTSGLSEGEGWGSRG